MITREQALCKLKEMVSNQNLIRHCLAVEAAMLGYADYFGVKDPREREKWAIAGLIHDADWEKYPDEHPQVIIEWLKGQSVSDDIVNAVASHGEEFGIEPKTLMAKVLRAVDETTGFIVAVALVKGKDLYNVTIQSILKKWKKKDFARAVDRRFVEKSVSVLEVPFERHLEIVLKAMQNIKKDLGL